jgi:hypothetical protein
MLMSVLMSQRNYFSISDLLNGQSERVTIRYLKI